MYMSPEQALGRVIDARSDLYSLAVVAYRCLAGRTPFDHAAPGEMIVAVSTQPAPPPSQFNPALPLELDAWFAGMLIKDPAARSCQTALELAESFDRACGTALRNSSAPPVVIERRAPRDMPGAGATLVSEDDEAKVPSADEIATTVLVPNFSAQLTRRRKRGARAWLFVALGVAAGAALALWPRQPQRPEPTAQASIPPVAAHDETTAPAVPATGMEAALPPTTSSSAPAPLAPASNAAQKGSSATPQKSLQPRKGAPPVAPAASSASADLHAADKQESVAPVSAPAPATVTPPPAAAPPSNPAPGAAGIDRGSPW
jgi:serine/threonine-protein kinase